MSETLPQYHTAVNPPANSQTNPQPMFVYAILTDGEYILDYRAVHPDDIPAMNEQAQAETEGELQWGAVTIRRAPGNRQLFETVTQLFSPLQAIVTRVGTCQEWGATNEDLSVIETQVRRLVDDLRVVQRELSYS